MTKNFCLRSSESPQKAKLQQVRKERHLCLTFWGQHRDNWESWACGPGMWWKPKATFSGKQKITEDNQAHKNTRKKMNSNSSLDCPQVLQDNGTYKCLHLEGNVSYVDFYLHQPLVTAVFITSYLLIFLLCMVGNWGVCFIILWSRHVRTVTNLFILNLAISDLLVGLFCMPTTLLDSITAGWPFGSLVCRMSRMVQAISVSASVFTLVAIAVDRLQSIVHPFKQKMTIPTAVATILVIWILAVATMCPSAVLLQVQEAKRFQVLLGSGNATCPVFWCWEEWPDPGMRKIYTTALFASIYLAPLSLVVVTYAGSTGTVHGRGNRTPSKCSSL